MKQCTQVQQVTNPDVLPKGIRVGRILLVVGSAVFFLASLLNIVDFVLGLAGVTEEFVVNWDDPFAVIQAILRLPLAAFLVFAGIGGISFAKDKGPFISLTPLAAVICLFVCVFEFILDLRVLISDGNWLVFLTGVLVTDMFCGIYGLGWIFAKDYMDKYDEA